MQKKNKDLVSIILPSYNCEKTITKTIESVINQSFMNWELIIVDDGSTDKTFEIITFFKKQDRRIKCFKIKNSGPAVARQFAYDKAIGNFISFLDSDDIWLPNKLKVQINYMIEQNLSFTYTSFRRFKQKKNKIGKLIKVPKKLNYYDLLGNTAIATSSVVINRNHISEIKTTKCHCDDFVLWLSILKSGIVAYGINEDLMRYQILSNSWSRNKFKNSYNVWITYRKIEQINFISSIKYFFLYSMNAIIKYVRF